MMQFFFMFMLMKESCYLWNHTIAMYQSVRSASAALESRCINFDISP